MRGEKKPFCLPIPRPCKRLPRASVTALAARRPAVSAGTAVPKGPVPPAAPTLRVAAVLLVGGFVGAVLTATRPRWGRCWSLGDPTRRRCFCSETRRPYGKRPSQWPTSTHRWPRAGPVSTVQRLTNPAAALFPKDPGAQGGDLCEAIAELCSGPRARSRQETPGPRAHVLAGFLAPWVLRCLEVTSQLCQRLRQRRPGRKPVCWKAPPALSESHLHRAGP